MTPQFKWPCRGLALLALLAFQGQGSGDEFVTREYSVFSSSESDPAQPYQEFITREYSVFSSPESAPDQPYREFITREYSVFSSPESDPDQPYQEFITREYSVYANSNPPVAVAGLQGSTSTSAYGGVNLDWSSYASLELPDVVRYRIYAETTSFSDVTALTPVAFVDKGTFTTSVTGLPGNQNYFFAVAAEDAAGNFTGAVSAIPALTSVASLGEVVALGGNSSTAQIDFEWQAPLGAADFLAGYRMSFDGQWAGTLGAAATNWLRTGLLPATGYTFTIQTEDVFGNISAGATINAATLIPHPTNLRYSLLGGDLILEWDAVSVPGLVQHYAISQNGSPLTTTSGTSINLGAYPGLIGETFHVEAVNLLGDSSPSAPTLVVPAESAPVVIGESQSVDPPFTGQSVVLEVAATGFPPPDYQWYQGTRRGPTPALIDAHFDGIENEVNPVFAVISNGTANTSGVAWDQQSGVLTKGANSGSTSGIVSTSMIDVAGLGTEALEARFVIAGQTGAISWNGMFVGLQHEQGGPGDGSKLWNNTGPSFGINIHGGRMTTANTVAISGNQDLTATWDTYVHAVPTYGIADLASIEDGFEVIMRVSATGWAFEFVGLLDTTLAPITGSSGTWAEVPFGFADFTNSMRLACAVQGGGGQVEFNRLMATLVADSDGDGMEDGWELSFGLDPNDPTDGALDNDATGGPDGLTNLEEFRYLMDPTDSDTDDDGENDGVEVSQFLLAGETERVLILDNFSGTGDYWAEATNTLGFAESAVFSLAAIDPQVAIEEPVATPLVVGENRDFGDGEAGLTSATKLFTVRNTGAVPLTLTSLTLDDTLGPDFSLDATGLAASLAPGATTTFSVTFAPLANGDQSAVISLLTNDGDDETFLVTVSGSARTVDVANAKLAALTPDTSVLSPTFKPLVRNYAITVPFAVTSLTLTPTAEEPLATLMIDGAPVASGMASPPLALGVGSNLIPVTVTSQDSSTVETYTVTVTRSPETSVTTGLAGDPNNDPVALNGLVTPQGKAEVFFEYGPDSNYGFATATQYFSGANEQAVAGQVAGLAEGQTYHYRLVAVVGGHRFEGAEGTFIKSPRPPLAFTGEAAEITDTTATLQGTIDPGSFPTDYHFEYGVTELYGSSTPPVTIPADSGPVDVSAGVTSLLSEGFYHFRIVAVNSQGSTASGDDATFLVDFSNLSLSTPSAVPIVTTGGTSDVGTSSATLLGQVNANGGATFVEFEYGPTTSYGQTTETLGIGNGETDAAIALVAEGLLPGTTYHYRISARNSLGTSVGTDGTFQTPFEPPLATTGTATALDTTSVLVDGAVRARGTASVVYVEFGTDRTLLTQRRAANPGVVNGFNETPVTVELTNLSGGVVYYYRVCAESAAAGVGAGKILSFNINALSGLDQAFPTPVPMSGRNSEVTVNLEYRDGAQMIAPPAGAVGGWRFLGEHDWRADGTSASGLAPGERIIEFRPIPGFEQPASEVAAVFPGSMTTLDRDYQKVTGGATGSLRVTLKPASLSVAPGWRFLGETTWRDNSEPLNNPLTGLGPGNYIIEAEPVLTDDYATPLPVNVRVFANSEASATLTYRIAEEENGTLPSELPFDDVSSLDVFPYPFAGQLRSDAGKATGFVVQPCVVATAAHVVFDDGTLSAVQNLQWLFQQHRGVHQPVPQTPRGFYLMTGYADQRASENTPGESTPDSQNLDVAAMYFAEDAGRGGYSGFLASDLVENEYLLSNDPKILVGYPIDGVTGMSRDRMHATAPDTATFTKAFKQTYTSSAVRSSGGSSGGPLCVLDESGSYYPAAVYLGGTGQTVVRAIDSEVVSLFGFAAASCGRTGAGAGSAVVGMPTAHGNPTEGSLTVIIEPAEAVLVGAGWRINALEDYNPSGDQLNGITPADYDIQFTSVPGYEDPIVVEDVTITAGQLTTVTFTYEELVLPPLITSSTMVQMELGERVDPLTPGSPLLELGYQIIADNTPTTYSLAGVLPQGVVFNSSTGTVTGVPLESGFFEVTVAATNAGGADSQTVSLLVRPAINFQTADFARNEAGSYQILTSETGGGLGFTAEGLPAGLVLDPVTGILSGTPTAAGEFNPLITVTRRNATSLPSRIRINVTALDEPPVFVVEPEEFKSVEYGLSTTLVVQATGAPVIRYQWYEGAECDTNNPVFGASSPTFVTPPVTEATSFWVLAYSINGSQHSRASVITVTPSTDAGLADLRLGTDTLAPAFNPGTLTYTAQVANPVDAISVTPTVEVDRTTVEVEGLAVTSGNASAPVPLSVGPNVIDVLATAEDGSTRRYTITVTRLAPPTPVTGGTSTINDVSAVLQGTVDATGGATVFFEYGTSTAYGAQTPARFVPGTGVLPVQDTIFGLSGGSTYHYRLCVVNGTQIIHGADQTFTTSAPRPLVSTGSPVNITATGGSPIAATLVGSVDTLNLPASAFFRYRKVGDPLWIETAEQALLAETSITDVSQLVTTLAMGESYEVQLVANRAGGTGVAEGEVVTFVAADGSGGDGIIDGPPIVTTGSATGIAANDATLGGLVNPNDGSTVIYFDYGLDTSYGSVSSAVGVGNGTVATPVAIPVQGLLPGTTYHFRIVAANSVGTEVGADATFTTGFVAPLATTGDAEALSTTRALLSGVADSRGASLHVAFEYGTDGVTFPFSQDVVGSPISGTGPQPVSAEVTLEMESTVYYYRLKVGTGGSEVYGDVESLNLDALLGIDQKPPRTVDPAAHQGTLVVDLLPAGVGNWRIHGERAWRSSGDVVSGLATGQRLIEYRPVSGWNAPPAEQASIISGGTAVSITGQYYAAGVSGTASLTVNLGPAAVTSTAQWRLLDDEDPVWRNSGDQLTQLESGSHLIELSAVAGWSTPVPTVVELEAGDQAAVTINYSAVPAPPASPPAVVTFGTSNQNPDLPYAFVGQIETDAGSFSGVVVKPRVVATAAQAVFDDETLAFVPDARWFHQRERGVYEPSPQTPRGYYVFDGYAMQREDQQQAGGDPQDLDLASRNLNVAALYFYEDAGRGGYAGFLASDDPENEFVTSSEQKTLVGYPTANPVERGKMHATPLATDALLHRSAQVYGAPTISGGPGFLGGPLFVQYIDSLYYPAAIFVGTGSEGQFRVIDGEAVDLIVRAAVSANGGGNNTSGGITHTSFATFSETAPVGVIEVELVLNPLPVTGMGGWRLKGESLFRDSATRIVGRQPGSYVLEFEDVPGFQPTSPQQVEVRAGETTFVVFTYESTGLAPDAKQRWRLDNFGSIDNMGDGADGADPDGDGRTNENEFVALTDPNDAGNYLRVESIDHDGASTTLFLSGRAGRTYTLEWLDNETWQPLGSQALSADQQVDLVDPSPPASGRLYRVVVAVTE